MTRVSWLITILFYFLSISAFGQEALKALKLGIDKYGYAKQVTSDKGVFDRGTVGVYVIPLNEDIIHLAVAYKAEIDNLSTYEIVELKQKAIDRYWKGTESAFLLFIDNRSGDGSVSIKNISVGTEIVDEFDNIYSLKRNTKIFEKPISEGDLVSGYLYFPIFLRSNKPNNSFTFNLSTIYSGNDEEPHSISFVIDNSEIGFLGLIEKGLPLDQLKETYLSSDQLTISKFIDVAATIVGIITLVK